MTAFDFFEWTWTVSNALGVFLNLAVLWDAHYDYQAARLPDVLNGRRGIYAAMYLRNTLASLVLQLLFFVVGVGAILTPNQTPPTATRYIYSLAAITLSLVLNASAALNWIDRRRIKHYRQKDVIS